MSHPLRLPLILVVLALVLAFPASTYADSLPAGSATATAVAVPAPSTDELSELVQTLQRPEQRARLIGQIQALIAVQKEASAATTTAATESPKPLALGSAFVAFLSDHVKSIGAAVSAVANLESFSHLTLWAGRMVADPEMRFLWLEGAAIIIGVLGMAIIAERGADALLGRVRRRLRVIPASPAWAKIVALLGEVLLCWLPILVFLTIGYASLALALAVTGSQDTARVCVLAILHARALVRAITIGVAVALERTAGGIGRVRLDEETADYWMVWLGRLVRYGVYAYYALGTALNIGMTDAAYAILLKVLGFVFASLLVMLLLQNRAGVARFIRGQEPLDGSSAVHGLRVRAAEIWHLAAILYIAGGYGVWAANIPGGLTFLIRASLLSAIVLIAARLGAVAGTRLANRLLAISPDLTRRLPDLQNRVNLYSPALIGIGRGLIYAVAGLLVLQIWDLDVIVWLASGPGLRLVSSILIIALTAVVAMATWEAVGLAIHLYLVTPGGDRVPVERSARARTLLPLFRKTLAFLLSAAVALVILSELGVNIGPLLAGAGIVGIAVGFGAQTLVKDVITGLFILMQDAVAVGDVVTVAGNSGLVEQISIRSIRLRDLNGTVIIVPFSAVGTVHNMTKDFSYALFNIGISYREDVDKVIDVITALAEEMYEDREYRWQILDPIEVLGLDQFTDSAVVIKARIKTKPIQQWTVMREFNRRLKRRFDELGIEIPFPHRTVYFGVDKMGGAAPAHIVTSSSNEDDRRGKWASAVRSSGHSAKK